MPSRRQFLAQGCAAALSLAFVPRAGSQQDGAKVPDGSASKDMITPEAQKAIDKGLAYLAGRQPGSPDADLSVTVCQIMALRAARNAGFSVPKSTVDKCTQYVKRCQNLREGGFRYQTTLGPAQFARSAAGLVALNCAGIYKGEEVDSALKYLMRFIPIKDRPPPPEVHLHYYYGHYYAAQAMWTAGG